MYPKFPVGRFGPRGCQREDLQNLRLHKHEDQPSCKSLDPYHRFAVVAAHKFIACPKCCPKCPWFFQSQLMNSSQVSGLSKIPLGLFWPRSSQRENLPNLLDPKIWESTKLQKSEPLPYFCCRRGPWIHHTFLNCSKICPKSPLGRFWPRSSQRENLPNVFDPKIWESIKLCRNAWGRRASRTTVDGINIA